MSKVTVRLPSLLHPAAGGSARVTVEAGTIDGALAALVKRHPALGVHLFDESGDLREHVLCFHNDTNTRWLESRQAPVADGDTITILQAVSGG